VQMAYYGPRRPAKSKVRLLMPDIDHSLAAVQQTVLDVRLAGAWLAAQKEVDKNRLGIVGTSLGSFMGTLSAEMEPRFRKVAIVLGGGGLVDAFYEHPLGGPLRAAYAAMGGTREKLQQTIAHADPITRAANLRDRQVLMIGAKKDEIVPPSACERMWKELGEPKIVWYDAGHYTAIFHIHDALSHVVELLKK
jgi:dipeptidyl aminopeptidase/acylaminoacyl peptidase